MYSVASQTFFLSNPVKVIAVPTDTIYGIAGLAQNSEAVNRIYEIKGRDSTKPVAICLNEIKDIHTYAQVRIIKTKTLTLTLFLLDFDLV